MEKFSSPKYSAFVNLEISDNLHDLSRENINTLASGRW